MSLSFQDHSLASRPRRRSTSAREGPTYAALLFVTATFENVQRCEICPRPSSWATTCSATDKGTFIINGTERVVVSRQLVRRSGVSLRVHGRQDHRQDIYVARVIPSQAPGSSSRIDQARTSSVSGSTASASSPPRSSRRPVVGPPSGSRSGSASTSRSRRPREAITSPRRTRRCSTSTRCVGATVDAGRNLLETTTSAPSGTTSRGQPVQRSTSWASKPPRPRSSLTDGTSSPCRGTWRRTYRQRRRWNRPRRDPQSRPTTHQSVGNRRLRTWALIRIRS